MINNILPEAKKVLILAPHPDDEALGCGGAIALYSSGGAEVRLAVISDGKALLPESTDRDSNIVEARKAEALNASGILGIEKTYFLGFPDGELKENIADIKIRLEDIIKEFHPDIIFSPSLLDYHKDHMAVSIAVIELSAKIQGIKIAFYEVYETIRFNLLVDITNVMDIKRKAVMSYEVSLLNCPEIFFESIKGLNRFRSFYTRQEGYYEAFWLIDGYMEKTEILKWLTYDMSDPAELFLSKSETVDELLFELQKSNDLLAEKERKIGELQKTTEDLNKTLSELRIKYDEVTGSLSWKAAKSFRRIRDSLLPHNTALRKIYDRLTYRLKQ